MKSFTKKLDSGGYEGDIKKSFKEHDKKKRSTSDGYMSKATSTKVVTNEQHKKIMKEQGTEKYNKK